MTYSTLSRAEVYVVYKEGNEYYGHVFVAEKRNGNIYFLDPQNGELNAEYYFESVMDGLTEMFRIDELEINKKYIVECCEEAY